MLMSFQLLSLIIMCNHSFNRIDNNFFNAVLQGNLVGHIPRVFISVNMFL